MANLQQAATRAARAYGIPPSLFLELIKVESGWRPGIVSSAGAVGLTQLMPATARGLGVDPFNPQQNLMGGAKYLSGMFKRFGSWPLALAAYNAGAGAVEQHNGIPPYPETQHYVQMIMGALKNGAQTMGTPLPNSGLNMSAEAAPVMPTGPDLAQVGMQNLTSNASPFQSLENLTAAVRAGGGAQSVTSTSTPVGGVGVGPTSSIARIAMQYLGTPYVWGGESPKGFDCSGLLQWSAHRAGINIGRTTYQQFRQGHEVGRNQLQAGDAVFFRGSDPRGNLPGHVGIYIGHGEFIEAPHTGSTVRIAKLAGYPGFMGARRY